MNAQPIRPRPTHSWRRVATYAGGAAIVLIALTGCSSSGKSQESQPSMPADVVSMDGIHWHVRIRIFVLGPQTGRERQIEVPANLGIGPQYKADKGFDPMMQMSGIHTHDSSGTVHWEIMAGPVTRRQVQLAAFFQMWHESFNAGQVLSYRAQPGERVTMSVNGHANNLLGGYEIHDGDRIDIRRGKPGGTP